MQALSNFLCASHGPNTYPNHRPLNLSNHNRAHADEIKRHTRALPQQLSNNDSTPNKTERTPETHNRNRATARFSERPPRAGQQKCPKWRAHPRAAANAEQNDCHQSVRISDLRRGNKETHIPHLHTSAGISGHTTWRSEIGED